MPSRFEYRCPAGHIKEVTAPVGQPPELLCPACGQQMRRVPQPVRWYGDPNVALAEKFDDDWRAYKQRKAKGIRSR